MYICSGSSVTWTPNFRDVYIHTLRTSSEDNPLWLSPWHSIPTSPFCSLVPSLSAPLSLLGMPSHNDPNVPHPVLRRCPFWVIFSICLQPTSTLRSPNGGNNMASGPSILLTNMLIIRAGDIVSLTIFGQQYVILNTLQTSLDILEKRGAIYSDRPYLPMAGKLMGWDQMAPLSRYGEHFRHIRRLMHQTVGSRGQPEKVTQYHHIEEHEMRRFLRRLLDTPEDFAAHIRTYVFHATCVSPKLTNTSGCQCNRSIHTEVGVWIQRQGQRPR